jgi:acetyl-CoA carboxylase biotin carboxylase subunit
VPLDYDPLLAKLAVWAPSREHAIERMARALGEYSIAGIRTNTRFFLDILADPKFRAGDLSTAFLDSFFDRRTAAPPVDLETEAVAALVAALTSNPNESTGPRAAQNQWLRSGREEMLR